MRWDIAQEHCLTRCLYGTREENIETSPCDLFEQSVCGMLEYTRNELNPGIPEISRRLYL